VGFSRDEDPGVVADDVFCDGDDAGFCEAGGFEDLVGDVAVGYENDEPFSPMLVYFLQRTLFTLLGQGRKLGTYLWKTETQLRGPLAHCLR
jgi:hypothetical protein